MAESNPSSSKKVRRLRSTVASRRGISIRDAVPRANWNLRFLGRPVFPTSDDLRNHLNMVIHSGETNRPFAHPDLPGVELSVDDARLAVNVAMAAKGAILFPDFPQEAEVSLPSAQALIADEQFRKALEEMDGRTVLGLTVKQILISKRARHLKPGNGTPESFDQAAKDVDEAFEIVRHFHSKIDDPDREVRKMLRMRKEYSGFSDYQLALIAINRARRGIEEESSPAADIRGGACNPETAIVESLLAPERHLIARAMGVDELDGKAMAAFLEMHPGKREMALQRAVNEKWLSKDWRIALEQFTAAHQSVYSTCNIKRPTRMEQYEAACDPSSLSDTQRRFVSNIFQVSVEDEITENHIIAFRVWLEADALELQQTWDKMYTHLQDLAVSMHSKVDIGMFMTADTVSGVHRLDAVRPQEDPQLLENLQKLGQTISDLDSIKEHWFELSKEERMQCWRRNGSDLFSTASLAHKLRFGEHEPFTREEQHVASEVLAGGSLDTLDRGEKEVFSEMFRRHSERGVYRRHLMDLAQHKTMDIYSLRNAAYHEAEFRTLVKFLSIPYGSVDGKNVDSVWGTMPKESNGQERHNEDSHSSVEVTVDGEKIRLDMVADGAGGHKKGGDPRMSNGRMASQMAKEVFDICALAGWIQEPEDLRRTILLADLAIVMEQIRRKERDDDSMENDMATTMSIMMQRGSNFWGAHTGDSEWEIIRDGDMMSGSVAHTAQWDHFRRLKNRLPQLKEEARSQLLAAWEAEGFYPSDLDDKLSEVFESAVEKQTQVLFEYYLEKGKDKRRGIVSAVGHAAPHIHINNQVSGYKALEVRDDDIFLLGSDGATVPICPHEFYIFAKEAGWDLAVARMEAMAEAGTRVGQLEGQVVQHQTQCECGTREGNLASDDITVMMRYGNGTTIPPEGAFPEPDQAPAVPSLPDEVQPDVVVHDEGDPASMPSLPEESAVTPTPGRRPKKLEPTPEKMQGTYDPKPIFASQQTNLIGQPLEPGQTRYLDTIVLDVHDSEVVREVARELNVTARDLEIMMFYAYTCSYTDDGEFHLPTAIDPDNSTRGFEMGGSVPMHLITVDAERILRASFLIYNIAEVSWGKAEKLDMLTELRGLLNGMEASAEYTERLSGAVFKLQAIHDPSDAGGKPQNRRKKA